MVEELSGQTTVKVFKGEEMKEFVEGQEVYSSADGSGKVVEVNECGPYPVWASFGNDKEDFTKKGFRDVGEIHPALFHSLQDMKDYFSNLEGPKKKKTIKAERWINIYSNGDMPSYRTQKLADNGAGLSRLECLHICKEYEVDE